MGLTRVTGDSFTNRFGTVHDLTAADDSNAIFSSTDDVITVTTETSLSGTGQNFIFNKTIIFSGTSATFFLVSGGTADNTGRHIDFINCNLIFDNASNLFGVASAPGSVDNRGRDGRVASGAAATASVNIIGCTINLYQVTGTMHGVFTDLIDSDIRYGTNETDALLLHQNRGARNMNTTEIYDSSASNVNHNFYGPPESYNSPVIEGGGIRIGSGSSGGSTEQVIIPNLQQQVGQTANYWSFGDTGDLLFVVAGFRKVLDVANTLNVNDWTANQPNQGTVIYCQPYNPTVSTTPLLDTQVIGTRFRITSNANITWNGQVDAGITTGARAQNYIQEFMSNAEGRLLPVRYSLDDGATFSNGYLDYGRVAQRTSTTATSFVSTLSGGQNLQDGVALLPIQLWHTTAMNTAAGFAPTNSLEIRAYANDIDVNDTARIDANFNEGDTLLIQNDSVIAADIVGTTVKSENIDSATRLESFSFSGTTPVSLNDIRNYYRSGWSTWEYDGNPNTDDIRIEIEETLSTPRRSDRSVAIPANGLGITAGDLFFADTNIEVLDMGGNPINGTADQRLTISTTQLLGAGNITFTNLTVTDPTTLNGVQNSTVNMDSIVIGIGTFSDTTWNTNVFLNVESTSFTSNNVFNRDGTVSFGFEGLSGTTNLTTLFGTNYSFINTGTIILTSDAAVTIEVNQADVDLLGLSLTEGNTLVDGNITYSFPEVRPMYTVEVDAVRAGFLYIYDVTGDVAIVDRVLVGTETDTTITLDGETYADGNQFYGVYWPDSTLENTMDTMPQDVYLPSPITWTFSEGNQILSATMVAAVLEDGATGVLAGQAFTTTNTGDKLTTQTTISITGANVVAASGGQSLSEAILINNDPDFRRTFVNRQETIPYLSIGLNNATVWRDFGSAITYANAPFRFESGDTSNVTLPNASGVGSTSVIAPAVQAFSNWNNQIVRTDRGVTEVVSIPEGTLTAQQAQITLGSVIDTAGLPSRQQIRVDLSNQSNTGQVFNSDGTVVLPDTTPAD